MRAFQIAALVETAVRDERERGIIRSKALKDAARQALEVLEVVPYMSNKDDYQHLDQTITTLRAALAEPVSKAQA